MQGRRSQYCSTYLVLPIKHGKNDLPEPSNSHVLTFLVTQVVIVVSAIQVPDKSP